MKQIAWVVCSFFLLFACKNDSKQPLVESEADHFEKKIPVRYAKGFSITEKSSYTLLEINSPWPGAEKRYRYALVEKGQKKPEGDAFDAVVFVPVERIIVTSTTHIPALEMLGVADRLVGFPNPQIISSESMRSYVEQGNVADLGQNEAINTEIALDTEPNIVVGFGIDGQNKAFNTLEQAGIPVLYNGDWTEQHPLGKAEWIKFFGLLFQAETAADVVFDEIVQAYNRNRALAQKSGERPTVFSGALWNDVWYMPQGDSWGARFLEHAGADYLWADSRGTGSAALNVETVLDKAAQAQYWIGPAQYTSLADMQKEQAAYGQFDAFKNRNVYTFSSKKGAGGGLLYYELAAARPDWVLKDLVKILHPDLLPEHSLIFYERVE